MKRFKESLVIIFTVTIFLSSAFVAQSNILAEDTGLVTVQSKESFDATVKDLRQYISKNGMMVLSELNLGKVLSMTGLSLNAISLFVGNPQIGNKLFSANKGVGIAVPVRLNIFENKDGKTYVSYVRPSEQLSTFNEEVIQKTAKMLDKKLEQLTGMISR